jgi:cleavage and polyadenylation specificity factor subunit 2
MLTAPELINHTLETSRSVLMPCDPSPRLLELLVLLDQHWSFKLTGQQRRQNGHGPSNTDVWPYPLCLVSRTAQDMVAFARSLIEWMGGVVRDSGVGAEDVVGRKGKKGGKRNRGGAAIGSEYGALDFR